VLAREASPRCRRWTAARTAHKHTHAHTVTSAGFTCTHEHSATHAHLGRRRGRRRRRPLGLGLQLPTAHEHATQVTRARTHTPHSAQGTTTTTKQWQRLQPPSSKAAPGTGCRRRRDCRPCYFCNSISAGYGGNRLARGARCRVARGRCHPAAPLRHLTPSNTASLL
jgi:hypothetical protein